MRTHIAAAHLADMVQRAENVVGREELLSALQQTPESVLLVNHVRAAELLPTYRVRREHAFRGLGAKVVGLEEFVGALSGASTAFTMYSIPLEGAVCVALMDEHATRLVATVTVESSPR